MRNTEDKAPRSLIVFLTVMAIAAMLFFYSVYYKFSEFNRITESRAIKCESLGGIFFPDGPRQFCVKSDSLLMMNDLIFIDGGVSFEK